MRPAGADNYLRWRRSIDEHLELRRLTWDEYGMFNWLCTKADPRAGTVRASWPTLAEQTGLSVNHGGKLCRSLKQKSSISCPAHRGTRGRLVEVAIDKFPLADGTYTALISQPRETPAEVPAEPPAELPADLLAELDGRKPVKSVISLGGRERERKRRRDSLRVRSAGRSGTQGHLTRAEALATVPRVLRETVELFWLKTGRDGLTADEVDALRRLEQLQTPAVIQKAITTAAERFQSRGADPSGLMFGYILDSLRRYTTRKAPTATPTQAAYRPGLTRLS